MWQTIVERIILTPLEFAGIALAFIIPFTIYKINQIIHKDMDPPWKKE
jgi:hypothetical protein